MNPLNELEDSDVELKRGRAPPPPPPPPSSVPTAPPSVGVVESNPILKVDPSLEGKTNPGYAQPSQPVAVLANVPLEGKLPASNPAFEENEPGMTNNLTDLVQTPADNLAATLLPNEFIIAEFDCYFPQRVLPLWKIILLLIITGGMYIFVMAYEEVRRWCYRNRCCTPRVLEFQRGRMAVTNLGRLLVWSQDVLQVKEPEGCCSCCNCFKCCCSDLCAAPTQYAVNTEVYVYDVSAIREVSQYFVSNPICCCFSCCCGCCSDFKCALQVSLNSYNSAPREQGFVVSSISHSSYFRWMRYMLGNSMAGLERFVGAGKPGKTFFIYSSRQDKLHKNGMHDVAEELAYLQTKFLSSVSLNPPEIVLPPNPDVKFDNFTHSSGTIDGTRIVYDDCSITVPQKWLQLYPDEKVYATCGNVYIMKWKDWLFTILSFGLYYCLVVRGKKFCRAALVLTNKRIIEVSIYDRSGTINAEFHRVSFVTRIFLPGAILSGEIHSFGKRHLVAKIETSGGCLSFEFLNGPHSLPFAQALMMSTLREEARLEEPVLYKPVAELDLAPLAPELLPFIPKERILDRLESKLWWEPFCFLGIMGQGEYFCSRQTLGWIFPFCIHLFSCALRPFQRKSELIITNTSVFTYYRLGNYGIFGFNFFNDGPCVEGPCTTNAYFLAWSPIAQVEGHSFRVFAYGKENCLRRCLPPNPCCPLGEAIFELEVDTGSFNHALVDMKKNKNWHKEEKLRSYRGNLDFLLQEIRSATIPVAERF